MQNVRKVNDTLDHKKHIAELELKMKQIAIESHPAIHFNSNGTNGVVKKEEDGESGMSSSMSSHDHRDVIGDQPSIPIAVFDDIPVHSFSATYNDRGDNELDNIKREIRDSMMRRETLLDAYCDDVIDKQSHFSANTNSSTITKIKKLELNNNQSHHYTHQQSQQGYTHGTIKSVVGGQQSKNATGAFDQKKKSKLLAALKAIDGSGESIEK